MARCIGTLSAVVNGHQLPKSICDREMGHGGACRSQFHDERVRIAKWRPRPTPGKKLWGKVQSRYPGGNAVHAVQDPVRPGLAICGRWLAHATARVEELPQHRPWTLCADCVAGRPSVRDDFVREVGEEVVVRKRVGVGAVQWHDKRLAAWLQTDLGHRKVTLRSRMPGHEPTFTIELIDETLPRTTYFGHADTVTEAITQAFDALDAFNVTEGADA